MITVRRQAATSPSAAQPESGNRPSEPAATPQPAPPPASPSQVHRGVETACLVLFVALGVACAFPVVWGLALHQTPMAVSGFCAELMCLLVLVNRWFASSAAREHEVPTLAALNERPWVLAACLLSALASAVILLTYWPGAAA